MTEVIHPSMARETAKVSDFDTENLLMLKHFSSRNPDTAPLVRSAPANQS
jgi:hypothetical protein